MLLLVAARRTRQALERAVDDAATPTLRARAEFALAVFHDNNSRETEAIPFYRAALRSGLPPKDAAEARAWLASSLYKTGAPEQALREIAASRRLTRDAGLLRFLDGLERRVRRAAR